MNLKTGIGKKGVALAIIIAFAMCILSLLFKPVAISPVQYGICLPSPDAWDFNPIGSWVLNTVIIAIITFLLYIINKSYNFIRTTEPTLVALFMTMAASSPWFTQSLNTSVILCLANIVCMGIIFGTFATRNATQQLFILGVVIGIGSMFQYAFLPMAIIYFLWALFMKVLRIKETLAFLIGIVCPYWISIGIGWVTLSDLHFPSITPLFGLERDHSEFILLLISIGMAMLLGLFMLFINSMKLYAGNSQVNAMNLCVSALGVISAICILVDFDNMPAYVITLFSACAMQTANVCALWNPRWPWLVTVFPSSLYIAIFVCSLIF